MTDQDIMDRVTATIRLTFGVDPSIPISRETVSYDIDGWDSLSHSTLMIMVEKAFGISIPAEEGEEFDDVGALADFVASQSE